VRILHLITARGGSKGVPGKNLRRIGGLSLVGYKARAAQRSGVCDRLILSTESADIAAEGKKLEVEVPFMRPAELASDTAKSVDVISHAMDFVEAQGQKYDAVMLLEPSAPFGRPQDLAGAAKLMEKTGAQAVVSMREVEVASVWVGPLDEQGRISAIVKKMKEHATSRRQDVKQEYTMSGSLYLFRWDYFRAHRNIYHSEDGVYGYVLPSEYAIEIDEMRDLHYAEFLVEKGLIDTSNWT
jgi:CMP-N-acetylneuraminic acid synthetase